MKRNYEKPDLEIVKFNVEDTLMQIDFGNAETYDVGDIELYAGNPSAGSWD